MLAPAVSQRQRFSLLFAIPKWRMNARKEFRMQNMTFYFQLKLRSELGSNEKFCRRCGTLKRHFTVTKNTTVTLSWARTRTARSGVECTNHEATGPTPWR